MERTAEDDDSMSSAVIATNVTHEDIASAGIRMCDSTPLLWRVTDLKVARQSGVIGSLVGSLARQPRQNTRLGRPLELLPEEARLLAEEGKASVLTPGDDEREDTRNLVDKYHESLDRSHEVQRSLALQERKAVLQRVMVEKPNEISLQDRLEALDRDFTLPVSAMTVQLCTARAGLGYYGEEREFITSSWPVQRDERSQTKFLVFRDLRRRGFFLTSAGKFGGDYLVYPGDPLRFHAHFIAVCMTMDAAMAMSDILALARLGSNVKKTVILCSPRPSPVQACDEKEEEEEDEVGAAATDSEGQGGGEEDGVVYTSLQWSGMV